MARREKNERIQLKRQAAAEFGQRFQACLKARKLDGMTAAQLAQRMGRGCMGSTSESTVRQWLRGANMPNAANFANLARWLGCTRNELLPVRYQELLKGAEHE